jgi:sigma-B regulation protein RsbU (phosphoserine phosphatase)
MSQEAQLKEKIKELQLELAQKNLQISQYRHELLRVNEALEKIAEQFNHELKIAEAIQRVLSPTDLPHIQGVSFSSKFIPGAKTGGDYFEIFEHEDKMRFGILVCSSSGYVMSAAMLGVLIKLSAQIEARRGLEPEQVIKKIIDEVINKIESNDSSSLFYAIVNRRNFEMKYSSVGQIFGLLQLNTDKRLVQLQPSTGKLKKGFSEIPLSQSISLGPRDRLILCTEGLLEAQNSNKESFGKEGVQQAVLHAPRLGVHELRNEILFKMEQFVGSTEAARDITILVTEVKDRVIKLAKKSSV